MGVYIQKMDKVAKLANFAAKLKVPEGRLRGKRFKIADWQQDFLRESEDSFESFLLVSRKNGKTGLANLLILGYLVGPLNETGYRIGVVSLSARHANELYIGIEAIVKDTPLETRLTFRKQPYPGVIFGENGARCDLLAADKSSGMAFGFDLVILDEIGLYSDNDREMVNAMVSSTSARDGRTIALSVRGHSAYVTEAENRPGVVFHCYQDDGKAPLDDEDNWYKSNPGLSTGIKSLEHMRKASRRALGSPADQSAFAAYELNRRIVPGKEYLIDDQLFKEQCVVPEWELPAREGTCYAGADFGTSLSMTCMSAYWPSSNRLEVWGAYSEMPDLRTRGEKDNAGNAYMMMQEAGELRLFGDLVTDIPAFLEWSAERLAGEHVIFSCDGHKRGELLQFLHRAGVDWQVDFPAHSKGEKGSGAGGARDTRSAQRLMMTGKVKITRNWMLERALGFAIMRVDAAGNPALDKKMQLHRIDAASALILSLGLAEKHAYEEPAVWFDPIVI